MGIGTSVGRVTGLIAMAFGGGLVGLSMAESVYTPAFVVGASVVAAGTGLGLGLVGRRSRRRTVMGLLVIAAMLALLWLVLDVFSLCMGLVADCFPNRDGINLWLAVAALGVGGFLVGSRSRDIYRR
jgi:hypothetical protein